MSRRAFLKLAMRGTLATAVAGVGGLEYVRAVEPAWVTVQPVRLTLPRLASAFHGYRIAQISDIHMGDWMTRERLATVTALVNAQQPDLIALTGDFVTSLYGGVAGELRAVLPTLTVRNGVVAVLGNHDHSAGPAVVRQVLRECGIRELSNTAVTLQRGRGLLHLAGVDDVWHGQARLDETLAAVPTAGAAILLAHEPDFAATSAATGRFDLQLSGHSHGGQVVFPFVGPTQLPPLSRKYPLGRYQVGSLIQYTNRGVGMVRPHVRFNCPPEITLFTLESPQA